VITGSATGLNGVFGGTQDASNRSYVTNSFAQTVTVFAKNANGNVAPKRTIGGSHTGFVSPDGVAI